MKLVCVSDLHGHLPTIEPADVLVIAGDICPIENHKLEYQRRWLDTTFRQWLAAQPVKQIVATWGNHDWIGTRSELVPELPWTLLVDQAATIAGLKFYGTPWQPTFCDWAFNLTEPELVEKFRAIPTGLDVLVSHGPPYGIADKLENGERCGSRALRQAIIRAKPGLTVCGHIHAGRGVYHQRHPGNVINVSLLDEAYRPVHTPMVYSSIATLGVTLTPQLGG